MARMSAIDIFFIKFFGNFSISYCGNTPFVIKPPLGATFFVV